MMFVGQMGCEALNFVLKRLIKEERPKGKLLIFRWSRAYLPKLTRVIYRNVRQGIWNAIVTCPIHDLLLRLPHLLPSLPSQPSFRQLLPQCRRPPTSPGHAGPLHWSCWCRCQPSLPQLSHPETSPCRLCRWIRMRLWLVHGHQPAPTLWFD